MIVNMYKKLGISPLDAINEFKEQFPEYKNSKMGYAGRLDPMAEGVLLVMVGEENKHRQKYLGLDKTYEVQMVLNVTTDSYDVLGKVVASTEAEVTKSEITAAIMSYLGKQEQKYPPYSSQTIGGERMYKLARENRLEGVDIPSKQVEIYSIQIDDIATIEKSELQQSIEEKLTTVSGNFRQDEIKQVWSNYFNKSECDNYQLVNLTISCSSGTYIRSLVHEIGRKIGVGAFVYNLVRAKVGEYSIKDSIKI